MATQNDPNYGAIANKLWQASQNNQASQQVTSGLNAGTKAVEGMYNNVQGLTTPVIQQGVNAGATMAANTQPYVAAGQNAIGNLQNLQQGALNTGQFMDPSMQFTMSEGQKALERSAAARGGALSGAALKDLLGYSQGLATQNYNNAAQLALNDRQQRIGIGEQLYQGGQNANAQLAPVINAGSNALNTQAQNANSTGQTLANLYAANGISQGNYTAQGKNNTGSLVEQGVNAAGKYLEGGNSTGSGFTPGSYDAFDKSYWE